MNKLNELSPKELEALSLVEFQNIIVQEVRERWVRDVTTINEECLPYIEDRYILFVYSGGGVVLLEAGDYGFELGDARDILQFDPSVLCQVFCIGVGISYMKVKEKWERNRDAKRDERIEEEERAKYKLLHAKYGSD